LTGGRIGHADFRMTTTEHTQVRWHVGLAIGALCISASAVLLGLANTTPATATAARSSLAIPVVAALGLFERRRSGGLDRRAYLPAAACGVLFAADMLWWTQSIPEVGAGLSTVLVNTQIAIVPLLAWLVDRERVGPRFLWFLPLILAGVLLAGGVFEKGVTGTNPTWGTVHAIAAALCYSGFLFLLRRGGRGGRPLQTYAVVLVSSTVAAVVVGLVSSSLDFSPGWPTAGWLILVTVTGQLLGWLLVAGCSPRLPSDVGAALLLLTPIGAVVLGALVLAERPSPLQLTGCAVVLVSSYVGTRR
jgi:drug/metabolite transporter (DMT)-like permease